MTTSEEAQDVDDVVEEETDQKKPIAKEGKIKPMIIAMIAAALVASPAMFSAGFYLGHEASDRRAQAALDVAELALSGDRTITLQQAAASTAGQPAPAQAATPPSWTGRAPDQPQRVAAEPGDVELAPSGGPTVARQGEQAIEFVAKTMDGDDISSADSEGKPTLLVFWTHW